MRPVLDAASHNARRAILSAYRDDSKRVTLRPQKIAVVHQTLPWPFRVTPRAHPTTALGTTIEEEMLDTKKYGVIVHYNTTYPLHENVMRSLALVALLAPLLLLATLIATVLVMSRSTPQAISTLTPTTAWVDQNQYAPAPTPIITLPTVNVRASAVRATAEGNNAAPAQQLLPHHATPTAGAGFVMPYYSFGAPTSAADRG